MASAGGPGDLCLALCFGPWDLYLTLSFLDFKKKLGFLFALFLELIEVATGIISMRFNLKKLPAVGPNEAAVKANSVLKCFFRVAEHT